MTLKMNQSAQTLTYKTHITEVVHKVSSKSNSKHNRMFIWASKVTHKMNQVKPK